MALKTLATPMALAAALLLGTTGAGAQEPEGAGPGREEASHEGGEHEEHHKNAVGLVLGGTYESEEEKAYFTWGVEYERLFTPRFAILVGLENITEIDAWVLAAPFVYRHPSGWRLLAGPGVELRPRRSELERPEHGLHELTPEELEDIQDQIRDRQGDELFLLRFGTGWTFETGERFEIAPMVFGDAVREHGEWVWAFVFTVSVGFAF